VPDLTLRSSFIVGFPGETETEFEELLQWLDAAQLDRVGCFKYSPVEGATANELPGAVASEIMDERYARFMQKAAAISESRMASKVGREMTVIVDHVDGAKAVARSAGDAPDIDGVVNVKKAKGLRAGEFARVKITTAGTYDLAAEPL
jgi:ribosomal protein S12 methylthiotransferase